MTKLLADKANEALVMLWTAKGTIKDGKMQVTEAQREYLGVLDSVGITSWDSPTHDLTGTVVAPESVVVNEEELMPKLTPEQIAAVTAAPRLDYEKLEAAVKVGMIDPKLVAQCSTIVPSAKYVRISGTGNERDIEIE